MESRKKSLLTSDGNEIIRLRNKLEEEKQKNKKLTQEIIKCHEEKKNWDNALVRAVRRDQRSPEVKKRKLNNEESGGELTERYHILSDLCNFFVKENEELINANSDLISQIAILKAQIETIRAQYESLLNFDTSIQPNVRAYQENEKLKKLNYRLGVENERLEQELQYYKQHIVNSINSFPTLFSAAYVNSNRGVGVPNQQEKNPQNISPIQKSSR